MTDKSVWDREIPVPKHLIEYVDRGVREKLPLGTEVHGISGSGSSYWARTAKIDATDAAGNSTPFFMKVLQYEQGRDMVSAEYHAMSLLHSVKPDMVVEPVAWGTYTEEPDTHFFLCRFHRFLTEKSSEKTPKEKETNKVPDVMEFPELVADLHKRGTSKRGEFGFPITMYGGRNPQTFPVCNSWEECFSRGLDKIFDMEAKVQGADEEMHQLREGLMTKVIPRILRPLETGGRTLTPTLVHGDLWDGNVAVDEATGRPVIFDATPLYAHNEYELAPWWPTRHRMSREYIKEYTRHFSPSQPEEDFEDRVKLYSM
ncbi:Fructosamine/Ketosamine-3-kinase [Chaetomidium leptoderma]|uniref:protein-ribulosamine 3-kinase n=1 Tax=Chaetomidium leptoderma TaxID=669021 RepID=A0AAN6ZXY6_9PEZI|nr:Fructosamine/Ketosamine-3-kinase [Chaetomidium leptoderma]